MANIPNIKPTETANKSENGDEKHLPEKRKENALKTEVTETDLERSFKEGLANNSDTEKNSPQQK